MNCWHKITNHRWEAWGMTITRHWTLVPEHKAYYFMLFVDKEANHAGNNLSTHDTLAEAKRAGMDWLNNELDKDLEATQ